MLRRFDIDQVVLASSLRRSDAMKLKFRVAIEFGPNRRRQFPSHLRHDPLSAHPSLWVVTILPCSVKCTLALRPCLPPRMYPHPLFWILANNLLNHLRKFLRVYKNVLLGVAG